MPRPDRTEILVVLDDSNTGRLGPVKLVEQHATGRSVKIALVLSGRRNHSRSDDYRNLLVADILIKTLNDLKMEYPAIDYDPKSVVIED